jgi:hypothetical protein
MPVFCLETNGTKFAFLLQRAGLLSETAHGFNQTLAWAEALRTCVRKSWGVEIFVHDLGGKASPQIDPGQLRFRRFILAVPGKLMAKASPNRPLARVFSCRKSAQLNGRPTSDGPPKSLADMTSASRNS